jgi:hypothetical protein
VSLSPVTKIRLHGPLARPHGRVVRRRLTQTVEGLGPRYGHGRSSFATLWRRGVGPYTRIRTDGLPMTTFYVQVIPHEMFATRADLAYSLLCVKP